MTLSYPVSVLRPLRRGATVFGVALSLMMPAAALAQAQGGPTARAPMPSLGSSSQPVSDVERIAALVNEEVISYSDLMGRFRLALLSSGVPDSPEARQRLLPQVMRVLVEERLQVQEARRVEIPVPDQEVDGEIAEIARRNQKTTQQFEQMLAELGVPIDTLRAQTRAGISWGKLIQRRLRPTVTVADEDVTNRLDQIKANIGKSENRVAEIFLSVDDPSKEAEVRQLAERLVEQIASGANFGAVAQQFSQSAASAIGGEVGWIQPNQLEPELDRALQQLTPGQFSRPIRGEGGYHVFWLRERRAIIAGDPNDIQLAIGQLLVTVRPGTDPNAVAQQIQTQTQGVSGCPALQQFASAIPGAQLAGLPLTRLGAVPAEIRSLVENLSIGQATAPLVTDVGVMVLMVCDRVVPPGAVPPPDAVRNALLQEKMDMVQRRFMRDLRRRASVEIRI